MIFLLGGPLLPQSKLNGISPLQGFGVEFLLTLQLVVLCVMAVSDKRRDVGGFAPLAIGLSSAGTFGWDKFTASARKALIGKTSKPLVNAFNQFPGHEAEKKTTFEQGAERGFLVIRLLSRRPTLQKASVRLQLLSSLGDVLDCLPLDQCDRIFSFVEKNVSTWKSNSFYTAGKNYLLRMCNDLLRRLSKSQNTVFCGRIQLFLARLFPLSEKSGLICRASLIWKI
ncbi:hypothetical protein KUCAC02_018808 [Chaenocephalus aceratus]|uniref:Uncharacterized protein n=1 Tax=Chaenocephalus aceratus TaxID=36190 RepID=A0ACB9WB61_CHAAC|nr:hypothetical protein KUCAC02_018808 [Chaenocephalus aceratus]